MKKIIIAVLALPLILVACKKKDNTSNLTKLTANTWKITEVNISKDGVVGLDYYSTMKECEKDNFYTFNADYTITSNEGATKCDPAIQDVTTDGSWTLTENETKFTLKNSKVLPIPGDLTMKIVSLDGSTLKLAKDTTINYPGIPDPISGTINVTFTKK